MDRNEIVEILKVKIMSTNWHYFKYHFAHYCVGQEHPLCASIVNACQVIERVMPGYTLDFANKISGLSNKKKSKGHYDQIIQLLAELYVIRHLASDGFSGATFQHEPTCIPGGKNPEVGILCGDRRVYVEVKCPNYIKFTEQRSKGGIQLPARADGLLEIAESLTAKDEQITLPRDNVVKDFLISANDKFSPFKERFPNSLTLLVIVWDDFIYEPISALLNCASGLLTENSFFRSGDGNAHKFDAIGSILIVRHAHQIVRATRGKRLVNGLSHALEWGNLNAFPPKAYIPRDMASEFDDDLRTRLLAHDLSELKHIAEYNPQVLIL